MKLSILNDVINNIEKDTTPAELRGLLNDAFIDETGPAWISSLDKFNSFLDTGIPQFSIFAAAGNMKLPFLSFSVLPFITCPGAGDCLNYCYSKKAWRYPAAFFRQLQNTWLMMHNRETIAAALDTILDRPKFKKMETIDFRLYVDGDFSNMQEFKFWNDTLKKRPQLSAYGYSKSWIEILEYFNAGYTAAANYVLNLSSGSNHGPEIEKDMQRLQITRGRFIAVKMPGHWKQSDGHKKEYKAAAAAAYGSKKAFICPLNCGDCTKSGHMCGNNKAVNVPIIVPLH